MDLFFATFGYATLFISFFLVVTGILIFFRARIRHVIYFTIFYGTFFLIACPLLELIRTSYWKYRIPWCGKIGLEILGYFGSYDWGIWVLAGVWYLGSLLLLLWRHRRIEKKRPFTDTLAGKFWIFFTAVLILTAGSIGQHLFTLYRTKFALYGFGIGTALFIPILFLLRKPPLKVSRKFPLFLEIILLLLAVVTGAYLRIHNIDTLPPGCWFDEAENGMEALKIYRGEEYLPYTKGFYSKETLYLYFNALFFKIFGINTLALRLTSVFFGILTIPAFYVLLRYLFGKKVAIVVTFFFACSHWHLYFSRIAFRAIMMPLIQVLTTYFFLKAIDKGNYKHYILAGIIGGLGIYTYIAYRVFPVLLVILFIHQLFYRFVKEYFKPSNFRWMSFKRLGEALKEIKFVRHSAGMLLMGVAGLIVCSWMIWFMVKYPDIYLRRTSQVSIFNRFDPEKERRVLINNTRVYFLMFNLRGDANARHNDPGKPELDFVVGILALLGFGAVLLRFWQPFNLFLILWLVGLLVPGILTLTPPNCLRAFGTLPVAYVFAGISVSIIWRSFQRSFNLIGNIFMTLLMIGAIVFSFKYTYHIYFNKYPLNSSIWESFSYAEWAIAEQAKKFPSAKIIYDATSTTKRTINFLLTDYPANMQRFDYLTNLPVRKPVTSDVLFLMGDPYYQPSLPLIEDFYPEAKIERVSDPRGQFLFYSTLVTRDMINSSFGLSAVFRNSGDSAEKFSKTLRYSLEDLKQDLIEKDGVPNLPFEALWTGSLLIPANEEYIFKIKSNNRITLILDGDPVIDAHPVQIQPQEKIYRTMLTKGFHDISLKYSARNTPAHLLCKFFTFHNNKEFPANPAFFRIAPSQEKYKATRVRNSPYRYHMERTIIPRKKDQSKVFTHARGLTRDRSGNFWVADAGSDTVIKIDPNGMVIASFGGTGPEAGKLKSPNDVVCGPDGNIYVLDTWNGRIQVFDTSGNYLNEKDGGFWGPSSMAIGTDGTIYVCDNGNKTIKLFSRELVPISNIVGSNIPDGKFFIPVAVAVDEQNRVYVAESDNHRFQIVTRTGEYVNSWPIYSSGQLNRIQYISQDQILLVEANRRTITVYNDKGELMIKTDLDHLNLQFPIGLYFEEPDKLYILDDDRILVLKIVKA